MTTNERIHTMQSKPVSDNQLKKLAKLYAQYRINVKLTPEETMQTASDRITQIEQAIASGLLVERDCKYSETSAYLKLKSLLKKPETKRVSDDGVKIWFFWNGDESGEMNIWLFKTSREYDDFMREYKDSIEVFKTDFNQTVTVKDFETYNMA